MNTPTPRASFGPPFALSLYALILGYNWVVMKIGLASVPPFAYAAGRAVLGAVTLFVVIVALRRSLRPPATPWHTLIVGLLQTTGMLLLTTLTVASGAAGKAAVLVASMPLWIPLIARLVLGERIGSRWVAIALGLLGILLLVDPLHGTTWTSDAEGFCAALLWAAGVVLTKDASRSTSFDAVSFTAWQILAGSIPLVVVALVLHERLAPTTSGLLAVAFTGILATGLAFALFAYAMKYLPAPVAGAGSLAIPIIGVASASLQLGERPSALEWGGMACIVVALVIMAGFFPKRSTINTWLHRSGARSVGPA
jgi:drug/metabolite transporter (DMT)-like permease